MYLFWLEHRPFSHFLGCTKGRFRDFELFLRLYTGCVLVRPCLTAKVIFSLCAWFLHLRLVWRDRFVIAQLQWNHGQCICLHKLYPSTLAESYWHKITWTSFGVVASFRKTGDGFGLTIQPNSKTREVSDARQIIICEKTDCYTVSSDRDSVDI